MATQVITEKDGTFLYKAPEKLEYNDTELINHGGRDLCRSEFTYELDDGTLIYGWKSSSYNPFDNYK